jgi:hypothetical protein
MKELVFLSGPNCPVSVQMEEKVLLFESLNPDIKVTRLLAGDQDADFRQKSGGYKVSATPTFVALEDEKILEVHEGKACEVRLLKMFSPENFSALEAQDVEASSETTKLILFFGSSWCSQVAENKIFCDGMWDTMEEFSKSNPEVDILKIDVDLESHLVPENCYNKNIHDLPTVFLIKNGKFAKSYEGNFVLEDLVNLIN